MHDRSEREFMAKGRRRQAYRLETTPVDVADTELLEEDETETLELREEQLVAHTELRDVGEIQVSTIVEQMPGHLEVDAYREEVVIEHEPIGQIVSERESPSQHGDELIVPIYEEQLVVVKRLVLREKMHIRRVGTTERQLFEDTLQRERLVVDDPQGTGLVRELYPTDEAESPAASAEEREEKQNEPEGGFLEHLVRRALE